MSSAAIPHGQIRELRDRSWTLRLLGALHSAGVDERREIARTLIDLLDPRAVSGLTALVVSSAAAPALRELAGGVLRNYAAPPDAVLDDWWRRGDLVLRRHALCSMRAEAAEVIAVAGDPHHPLHAHVITGLTWGYEAPAHQQLKITALGHADARVRAAAADALHWDEPPAAVDALIAALSDPVPEVALAARATLLYYDSRRALRALMTVPAVPGAEHFAEDARARFAADVARLPRPVRAHLRPWLAPVADLLEVTEEAGPAHVNPPRRPALVVSGAEILAVLEIVDGPWAAARAFLGALDAAQVPTAARPAITARMLTHDDAEVREQAATWLAAWTDEPHLRVLLDDDAFLVRKAAAYAYAALPPDPACAPRLLRHLHRPGVASTHARETLRSYAAHADREELVATLGELAARDRRESVRDTAIELLTDRGAATVLAALMARLADPPQVTWAVHRALLEAARRLALPAPDAAGLATVDSLHLQIALAELATSV